MQPKLVQRAQALETDGMDSKASFASYPAQGYIVST